MKYQANRNYVSDDVVMTPRPLATMLVSALSPSGRILEPCAGDGAFVEALEPYAAGRVGQCEAVDGGFSWWTERVDWVVTNPPWSQFAAFLRHALEIADNVAMLATVNHWWTRRRVADVLGAGFGYKHLLLCDWPQGWPSSGFQLGMMHVSRGYVGPLAITDLREKQAKGGAVCSTETCSDASGR